MAKSKKKYPNGYPKKNKPKKKSFKKGKKGKAKKGKKGKKSYKKKTTAKGKGLGVVLGGSILNII